MHLEIFFGVSGIILILLGGLMFVTGIRHYLDYRRDPQGLILAGGGIVAISLGVVILFELVVALSA